MQIDEDMLDVSRGCISHLKQSICACESVSILPLEQVQVH